MTKTDIALIAGAALFIAFLLVPRSKPVDAPAAERVQPTVAAVDPDEQRRQSNERKLAAAETEEDCRADTMCWRDRHRDDMRSECGRAIEREAKNAHEWTYNRLVDNTDMFRIYSGNPGGPITGEGDQVKMQNAFGVWIPMRYSCTYDPATQRARLDFITERG